MKKKYNSDDLFFSACVNDLWAWGNMGSAHLDLIEILCTLDVPEVILYQITTSYMEAAKLLPEVREWVSDEQTNIGFLAAQLDCERAGLT